jgi:hypothetical protein
MNFSKKTLFLSFVAALMASQIHATPDPNFHCYLLFGQSNMAGGGAGVPIGGTGAGTLIAADCDTSTRVKVLAFCNCSAGSGAACTQYNSKSRTADTWYTAYPALHICNEGVSPGDWFAKTLLDSIRDDIKIGLIPCALSGMGLQVFVKGGSNFDIPTWAHPTLVNSSPYTWMLNRCKLAQQTGVIKGMLLHQGESGSGGQPWGTVAKQIFDDLKKDLSLDSKTPVVVGELRQGNGLNNDIDAFAKSYPNCGLASSLNLGEQPDDAWHFNPEGMRELGKRYAKAFLALASQEYVPRKGTTNAIMPPRAAISRDLKSAKAYISVYSLNGRTVHSFTATDAGKALFRLNAGGVYIVSYKLNDGRSAIVPFFKE